MNNASKIVIATLERHYSPPVPPQVKGIENLTYRLLVVDYLKALEPFTDAQLEAGMREFVDNWQHSRWPKVGEIVAVMRERKALAPRPGSRHWKDGYWPAVEKRRDDFVESFMDGTLARDARDEGWFDELFTYVRKVAWYQAQIIERCERQGKVFSCRGKDRDGREVYPKPLREFFLLEDLERFGRMTVNIPTKQVEGMKSRAVAPKPAEKSAPLPSESLEQPMRASEPVDALEDAFP